MRKMYSWISLLLSFPIYLSLFELAYSNDSGAKLVAGGLVLQKIEDIEMISEYLYISANKIEVNYIFENKTDRDITTIVAFPLPPFPIEPISDINFGVSTTSGPSIDNFVHFQTWVEGKKINASYKKEQKIGFAEIADQDVFQITFYWQQLFPAKKKINIRHEYKPVTGSGIPELPKYIYESITNNYCPDDDFKKMLTKVDKSNKRFFYNDIGYILTTGGNWAGGTIGDFRLVVDKGSPDALVTFCGNDVKKISPTQFEMRAKNFKPNKDIYVFIIKNWFKY